MKNLPVSRKVYADITSRVQSSLVSAPSSASEALRLVDVFLEGGEVESSDAMAMLAFNMIRAELSRAMERSARARSRAKARREAREVSGQFEVSPSVSPASPLTEETPVRIMLSRRERRAAERATRKRIVNQMKKVGIKEKGRT